MPDYNYANDGKIHTRFSELIRCTPNQIDAVIAEREGARRIETEAMAFGTERHAMWQEEAEKTQKIARCFGLSWPVSHIEQEFVSEIMPNVILHSRPDVVCAEVGIIPDYKTVVDGTRGYEVNLAQYKHHAKQRQLRFYAYQLGLHGIRITKGAFLCEIWSAARDTIIGYETVDFNISIYNMSETLSWIKPRAALLVSELQFRKINS